VSVAGGRSGELTNARTRIVGTRDGALADAIVAVVRLAGSVRGVVDRAWVKVGAVVSPIGWGFTLFVAAAFLCGYLLGWAEAIALGWSGLALLAIAAGYLVGRSGHEVDLGLRADRVVVGTKAEAEVLVRNPTRRRLPGLRVEVTVGQGLTELAAPALARGSEVRSAVSVPAERRGVVQVGPVRIVRGDPIGLLRIQTVSAGRLELFVHPKTVAIPSLSTGFVRDLEGNPTRDLTSSDVSFHAIREYQAGDERRNIHWKSTAKTGSFMVRQFEETRRSHLMVLLSLAAADFGTDEEFELAVSTAGSLGSRAIYDGRTVSIAVSERTPDFAKHAVNAAKRLSTSSPARLLDDLTRVERVAPAIRLTELARVASESAAGTSVVFLLCGSTVTASALLHASSQFPLGVEVVAIVCDPGAVPGLRRVAELSLLTIGYLEDLQKSLAHSRAA
jgi:uncharacterized protein (DUF58 family)